MPNEWPAVSVIVNTYNKPKLLDRALTSVVEQQGFDDFEVIVIHDGPASNETLYIITMFMDKINIYLCFSKKNPINVALEINFYFAY